MAYVIHGARGAQGSPLLSALGIAGRSAIALTRYQDAAISGADKAVVDCTSVAELTAVYRGADGVFVYLPLTATADRLAIAQSVVAAVKAARPARVVYSTSGAVADPSSGEYRVLADEAVSALVDGLGESGVSHAVIEPKLFLENLLAPPIVGAAREQGVLPYPLRSDFPVAWASHLDIAEVAVALLERPDISGRVAVGQDPAITGPDLAAAFGARFGREVRFEAITPDAFGAAAAPLIGSGPAAEVASYYEAMGTLPDRAISLERSAQKLLGISPRTTSQWLAEIDL